MYYYEITGYEKQTGIKGWLHNSCVITVYAEDEKEAILKAKQMINKKHYRISKVAEIHDHSNQEDMQILQLEMQKKMLDTLKGK